MRRRITYANVAATLALVFSMTGGALAAKHYLINSTSQISPKVLKKLKGKTGRTGASGQPGQTGATGAPGANGKEGPRGPGVEAAFSVEGKHSCNVSGLETYCFLEEPFTPTADGTCLVSVISQISGLEHNEPKESGPYFRVAFKEGSLEENDGAYGFYFEGSPGTRSSVQERTRLIPVKAGTTYDFGAFYGSTGIEWENHTAGYEVTYTCFGS